MIDGAIRPITIGFPQDAVEDRRRRIAATRRPERKTVDDFQGTARDDAGPRRLLGSDYDWSGCEARLNDLLLIEELRTAFRCLR
jgi:epoxide hydrolase